MAEKIKKTIPWFLILVLIGLVIGVGFNLGEPQVQADTTSTSVQVGNAAPTWTVNAAESPDSTTTDPTDSGTDVTFTAQASDPNTDDYYLAICKAEEAPTPGDDTAPTCGASGAWVICGPYDDDEVVTSCTYEVQDGDAESKAWFGYICDKVVGGGACNASYQAANSPFQVNRGASFTVVTDAGDPVDPGDTVTITTTADDPDSDGGADTLDIFVCKTAGATAAGCDGGDPDTWCKDDTTNGETNPTCSWTMDINETDIVTTNQCEGVYSYWPYIFDNHGFAATSAGAKQGIEAINTVSNVAPDVTAASLNLGSNFQLSTEESSDNIEVTGTVVDNNGCVDIDADAAADTSIYYYKATTKGYADCDIGGKSDDNYCYAVQDCVYDTGTCTGTTDLDATFTCTVAIKYHANPTDGANLTDSTWWDYTWRATLIGQDEALSDTLESSDIEMLSFMAYDVDDGLATINYGGPLAPDEVSADKTNTVEALGNVGLDTKLYSVGDSMCDNFPTCDGFKIAIAYEHWDKVDDLWADMTELTTTTSDELELDCLKSTSGTPASANVHWKIKIPTGQQSETYTGENTILGYQSEAQGWE